MPQVLPVATMQQRPEFLLAWFCLACIACAVGILQDLRIVGVCVVQRVDFLLIFWPSLCQCAFAEVAFVLSPVPEV
jgi:hypothetical protein